MDKENTTYMYACACVYVLCMYVCIMCVLLCIMYVYIMYVYGESISHKEEENCHLPKNR
jgi:Ca2+/Na+ antiporter